MSGLLCVFHKRSCSRRTRVLTISFYPHVYHNIDRQRQDPAGHDPDNEEAQVGLHQRDTSHAGPAQRLSEHVRNNWFKLSG